MAASTEPTSLTEVFQENYKAFAQDLKSTFPELAIKIQTSLTVPEGDRVAQYKKLVMNAHTPKSEEYRCPGQVLPFVKIPEALWSAVSSGTKEAVYKYLTLLDACALVSGSNLFQEGEDSPFGKDMEELLKGLSGKLEGIDFESITSKVSELFKGFLSEPGSGSTPSFGAADVSGAPDDGFPSLPERFLKGKLAKLAEEMIREFKPEDFGLRPEDIQAMEANPARAVEFIMKLSASGTTSDVLQKAMARIAKRLKDKVQRGELRPQELVAEAEELIKEFQNNPKFVNIMETVRGMFNMEDPDLARAAGREGEARRSIVQQRLRKKLEERQKAKKK